MARGKKVKIMGKGHMRKHGGKGRRKRGRK